MLRAGVGSARFTNKEVGVREVLFKDQALLQVNRITNYANRPLIVHITEINPATLAVALVTKDPWSGRNNS